MNMNSIKMQGNSLGMKKFKILIKSKKMKYF